MDNRLIGFITNLDKPGFVPAVRQIVDAAMDCGYRCAAQPELIQRIKRDGLLDIDQTKPDCIVAIGGDGTILRAAAVAAKLNVPILGVNKGRIGFLSEIEANDFTCALKAMNDGKYKVVKKIMLRCSVNGTEFDCLNDFLLYKRNFEGIAQIKVDIDGMDAGTYMCDGLIISTPTGSTGYSISAGGPVIAPGLEASIITPVCSHSLMARSIVCAAKSVMSFTMCSKGYLSSDGQQMLELDAGDRLDVTKSENDIGFICFKDKNLFALMKEKLT